ncbi:hypothetical protein B1218_36825 [Pseudomonas ogarae]|nr:hypothetical protein B1218_36825 [Pseudomonas ogarae]
MYWQLTQAAVTVGDGEQGWRCQLKGNGKAACGLDGTANVYAQTAEQLQRVRQDPGRSPRLLAFGHQQRGGVQADPGLVVAPQRFASFGGVTQGVNGKTFHQ